MERNEGRPAESAADGRSTDSFELLARLCPDSVLIVIDERVVYANPAADSLFCPGHPGGLPGTALPELASPNQRARLHERLAQDGATFCTAPQELQLCSFDGREFDAEVRWGVSDWNRRPAKQLLIRDISDRKAAATRLQAADSRLAIELDEMNRLHQLSSRLLATRDLPSALNEVLDAAISLLDADYGSIHLYNPSAQGLEIVAQRGFPQAFLDTFKLVQMDQNSACGRALRSGQRIIIEDVLTDEEYVNLRDIAAVAGYRAVQSTPLLVPGGTVLGMLSTHFRSPHRPSTHQLRMLDLYARQAVDLVDRVRTEQALRESEDRFRRALQPRNVGIVFTDAAGMIREANDAFLAMSGFARADLKDEGLSWETLTPPEWRDAAHAAFQEFDITGQLGPREHELLRKDGSRWHALCSATRIGGNEGVGYLIDISDRKRAEQELKEVDRRKDEFLATLAHELRNPLAPISNAMYLLKSEGPKRRRTDRLVEMVQRQVRHIVRLVDDLLEVSRITRGKIELRCAQVDLAAILRAAVETSKPMLDRGHQRLHLDLPDTALVLDADAVRLTQVFANLLHNAAKYTVECGDIWVEARRDGAEAVVSVRDTGAGIAADVLPRVFDLFAQGRDAPAASGLGIGLTMARSLVELHQGSIEARSEGPGRGSEFTVRLPLAQQPAPGQAALESAPESAPGLADAEAHAPRPDARRVLVVDDNRDAANSLALLLSAQGNEVQVAYGGQDALELLAKWMPDVAVVDIGMPGMDGCQLARRIRGDRRCAGLRLVALSGWGHAGARAQSQACGFDEHLTKPADIGVLGAILAATRGRPP